MKDNLIKSKNNALNDQEEIKKKIIKENENFKEEILECIINLNNSKRKNKKYGA